MTVFFLDVLPAPRPRRARGAEDARIVLLNAFVSQDDELRRVLETLWASPGLADMERHGGSFWFES